MSIVFENIIRKTREYTELLANLKSQNTPVCAQGLFETLGSHVIASVLDDLEKQSIIICSTNTEAQKVMEDLQPILGDKVLFLPQKEMVFFDAYAHSRQVIHERANVIEQILTKKDTVVVASIDSLMVSLMPPDKFLSRKIFLKVGETLDIENLKKDLLESGYERSELVEAKGQFAYRGGIIDVFSPSYDNPIRLELFDDEIDSIRFFDVETQKSVNRLDEIELYPCKEVVITKEEFTLGIRNFKALIRKSNSKKINDKIKAIIEKLEESIYLEEFDKYHSLFYENRNTIIDYFNPGAIVMIHNPDRVSEKAASYIDDYQERFKTYLEREEAITNELDAICSYGEVLASIKKYQVVLITNLRKRIDDFSLQEIIEFKSREAATYHGKIDELAKDLKRLQYAGNKIVISVSTKERAERIQRGLEDEELHVKIEENLNVDVMSSQIVIIIKHERIGYELQSAKYIMLTEHELFGVNKRAKTRKQSKDGRAIKSFRDLTAGDYVVHENHGIGKYVGIEQLVVENTKRDYLKITYSNDDFLYIPIDQMDLVQKYIGAEAKAVKLSKLSGNDWQKTKKNARKVIEDMTEELIALYAERHNAKGFQFSSDNDWQKQFEDLFPYEETPDQLKCVDEIKVDMQSEYAMDRLLCGDVGFGKTEVAIRAVFKAVMDGKQVIVLVPTTILAQQHYSTFVTRMSKYPVRIEMLSRFRTKKQQEVTIENLRTGVTDIVIGTHRVLSKDVKLKNLGLLVIDEEQRFGVKHKEVIKQLKNNVDVLTLTATPIPRTLHMSLIGIRDMSVIEDPPEERYPIQTYVVENDPMLLKDVIERELDRSGQTYYVHNRVEDIDLVASKIQDLVPDAKVVYAHGQMNERKLEGIMLGFMNHEFDVLVCTTIIETGLDISNANTIIMDDADKMGLSQLYQLKGRVGRSNRLAYAYLTYKKDKVLTEVAEKRLKAIKEFTELGAGFKIAMRDLEIRGAGNLLGSQQHGNIDAIGYDLYCKMLEQEVDKFRGKVVEEELEVTIDFKISAYIPSEFVSNQQYKLELYKKISSIRNQQDAFDIEEEIEDRYGSISTVVYNLLSISLVKALAAKLKVKTVTDKKDYVEMEFANPNKLDLELISKIGVLFNRNVKFEFTQKPMMIFRYSKKGLVNEKRLKELEEFLLKINNIKDESISA